MAGLGIDQQEKVKLVVWKSIKDCKGFVELEKEVLNSIYLNL